jgi:tRNA splicing endonuclease
MSTEIDEMSTILEKLSVEEKIEALNDLLNMSIHEFFHDFGSAEFVHRTGIIRGQGIINYSGVCNAFIIRFYKWKDNLKRKVVERICPSKEAVGK